MMARRYTMTLRCATAGCGETSICETESRREEAEAYARYAKHPYRCYRHARPDEVLSAENLTTAATLTANETKYGIYWGVTPDKATVALTSRPAPVQRWELPPAIAPDEEAAEVRSMQFAEDDEPF